MVFHAVRHCRQPSAALAVSAEHGSMAFFLLLDDETTFCCFSSLAFSEKVRVEYKLAVLMNKSLKKSNVCGMWIYIAHHREAPLLRYHFP